MTQRKPIISARRTENLEALLQKLWTLRPMYKDKQAFTITAGVAALIREIERTDLLYGVSYSPPSQPAAIEATVSGEAAEITREDQEMAASDEVDW